MTVKISVNWGEINEKDGILDFKLTNGEEDLNDPVIEFNAVGNVKYKDKSGAKISQNLDLNRIVCCSLSKLEILNKNELEGNKDWYNIPAGESREFSMKVEFEGDAPNTTLPAILKVDGEEYFDETSIPKATGLGLFFEPSNRNDIQTFQFFLKDDDKEVMIELKGDSDSVAISGAETFEKNIIRVKIELSDGRVLIKTETGKWEEESLVDEMRDEGEERANSADSAISETQSCPDTLLCSSLVESCTMGNVLSDAVSD